MTSIVYIMKFDLDFDFDGNLLRCCPDSLLAKAYRPGNGICFSSPFHAFELGSVKKVSFLSLMCYVGTVTFGSGSKFLISVTHVAFRRGLMRSSRGSR